MLSESNRMLVAGSVLIGALAAAAIGMRFGTHASSKAADGRVDAWFAPAVADAPPPGPATPYASAESVRSAGIQRVLQAVHDSLNRGDLASARVLLDAVLTIRKDEPQALLLKKELSGREEKARDAQAQQATMASATANGAQQPAVAAKSARQHRVASARRTHARENSSRHVTDTEGEEAAQEVRAAPPPTPAIEPAPALHADTVAAATPEVKEAPPAPIGHPNPPPAAMPQPSAPSVSLPQVANDAAPKTRDEVRNELIRARTNGSMSRFGNPDPVGPGGTPDMNAQPDIRLR